MDNRKEIVEKMINALNNRGGFDGWWHNIDEEIQAEIADELVNILPIQIVSKRLSEMEEAGKEATSLIAHLKDQHGFNDEEQASQDKIMDVFKYEGRM